MSETNPENEQGTFVGGTFGRKSDNDDVSTAEQLEAEKERNDEGQPLLAAQGVAPAEAEEFETGSGSQADLDEGALDAEADTEGVTTEPAPGERNEPV